MSTINDILNFWFEHVDDKTLIDKNISPFNKWFSKNEGFDREIRERFEGDLIKAQQGEYKSWEDSGPGRLALILLYDQFTRNMYRHTAKMFEADSLALELTLYSIKDYKDWQLQLIERAFLYMPLMHAEDPEIQKLSLKYFQTLVEESKLKNPQNTFYFEYTLGYAEKHHSIIEQFGRFPQRNSVLKIPSTPQELSFLKKF